MAGRIEDWHKAIQENSPESAKFLAGGEDRMAGLKKAEELGILGISMQAAALPEYLENPERFLDELKSDKYWVILNSISEKNKSFSWVGIDRNEINKLIKERLSDNGEADNYEITILEYFPNLYGGNIVISENMRRIIVEFHEGSQVSIARGSETPTYFAEAGSTGTIRYSFEDPRLRKIIARTIEKLPRDGADKLPGYYEFAIIKDNEGLIRPTIFDCRNHPAYQVEK